MSEAPKPEMPKYLELPAGTRISTGYSRIDRAFGGGLALGTVACVYIMPGGDSSFAFSIAANLSRSALATVFDFSRSAEELLRDICENGFIVCQEGFERSDPEAVRLFLQKRHGMYLCIGDAGGGTAAIEHAAGESDVVFLFGTEGLTAHCFGDVPAGWTRELARKTNTLFLVTEADPWKSGSGLLSPPGAPFVPDRFEKYDVTLGEEADAGHFHDFRKRTSVRRFSPVRNGYAAVVYEDCSEFVERDAGRALAARLFPETGRERGPLRPRGRAFLERWRGGYGPSLAEGLLAHCPWISYDVSSDGPPLHHVYTIIKNEYPELFCIKGARVEGIMCSPSLDIVPEYRFTVAETEEKLREIDGSISPLVEFAAMFDASKRARILHDYLVENIMLVCEGAFEGCDEIDGVLLYGRGSAQGMNRAFNYLCRKCGVGVEAVTGKHRGWMYGWNMVRVETPDGQAAWRHADVAADAKNSVTHICHDHFLLTDAELLAGDSEYEFLGGVSDEHRRKCE